MRTGILCLTVLFTCPLAGCQSSGGGCGLNDVDVAAAVTVAEGRAADRHVDLAAGDYFRVNGSLYEVLVTPAGDKHGDYQARFVLTNGILAMSVAGASVPIGGPLGCD